MPKQFTINFGPSAPAGISQLVMDRLSLGDQSGAIDTLVEAGRANPPDAGFWFALGTLAIQNGRTNDADTALRRCASLDPQNSFSLHLLGVTFQRLDDLKGSERAHLRSLALDPLESMPWHELGRLAIQDDTPVQLSEGSRYLRRALTLSPHDALATGHLGLLAMRQDEIDNAEKFLSRSVTIEPRSDQARSDLAGIKRLRAAGRKSRRPAGWPPRTSSFQQLDRLIDQYIFRAEPSAERFLTPQTAFYAFGSCFATHLSSALRSRGYRSQHTEFNEEANSTFANRLVLEWLSGDDRPATQAIAAFFGDNLRQAARSFIAAADVAVMTLGVAPCFFLNDTDEFVFMSASGEVNLGSLASQHQFRMTTVTENADNIRGIVSILRRMNPDIRIVFTVSPVPLAGVVGLGSAILADCVSKSTLRVAVAEALSSAPPGVFYFPSFEIVKWLGSHAEQAFFGKEDANSRHVSNWVVETVINAFLRRHSMSASPDTG